MSAGLISEFFVCMFVVLDFGLVVEKKKSHSILLCIRISRLSFFFSAVSGQ